MPSLSRANAFRAHVLQPTVDEHGDLSGFELAEDHVVVVDEAGDVRVARAIDEVREWGHERLKRVGLRFNQGELFHGDHPLASEEWGVAPTNADTHTHLYQPTRLGGRLMVWLERMFREGEIPAKGDPDLARHMASQRLTALAQNGTGRVIAWPTSSVESARIALEEAEQLGLEVRVGFVAMDQNVPEALREDTKATLDGLHELFEAFGSRVAVIDRFPTAVSSLLRQELVALARTHGALYEVHVDENPEEMAFSRKLYDGRTVVEVLAHDGVFGPGMTVGLAHAIHTTPQDRETIRWSIRAGCTVFIRACPNSNDTLESHWLTDEGERTAYVPFPLREWQNLGAIVTLGTDLGAGNNHNLYAEMRDEAARQQGGKASGDAHPSPTELLAMGTVNGARSFGVSPADLRIREGQRADFAVVRLVKPDASFADDPVECLADRLIRGGAQGSDAIVATYVEGRRVR